MVNTAILAAALVCTLYAPSECEGIRVFAEEVRTDIYESAYVYESEVYVPLQEVCETLGATAVIWDGETEVMEVEAPGAVIRAEVHELYMECNGRYIYIPGEVQYRHNRVMVPATAVAWAFGGQAEYLYEGRVVNISTGEPPESGSSFYGENDLYWLSRLIEAEAGGESMEGKISVGSVVMNRVESDKFPDTVEEVIFDKKFNIQFSPAYNGAIYNTPSEDSVIAAKLSLEGAKPVEDCLYFSAASLSKTCWAAKALGIYDTIGGQTFYG